MNTTIEREAAVRMMDMPVTLLGPQLSVGDPAPAIELTTPEQESVAPLSDNNRVVMLFSGPSIDASVCHAMTQRIDREAFTLPKDIDVYMVTTDMPFAMQRWLQQTGLERIGLLSDYRLHSFGLNFGVLLKDYRFLARAAFVIDRERKLCHAELVPEVSDQPNYMRAFAAAQTAHEAGLTA